jgi:hypothetical protein
MSSIEWKFVPYGRGSEHMTEITLSSTRPSSCFIGRNESTGLVSRYAPHIVHLSRDHLLVEVLADGTCQLRYIARQDDMSTLNNTVLLRSRTYPLTHQDTLCLLHHYGGWYHFRCYRHEIVDLVEASEPPAKRQKLNADKVSRSTADAIECSVCLETLVNPYMLPCGHSYCRTCIHPDWSRCPRCQQDFVPGTEKRNVDLQAVVSCLLHAS